MAGINGVHDVTGWLVKPRRSAEVGHAINQLVRDDFRRKSMGAIDTERGYDRLVAAGSQRQVTAVLPGPWGGRRYGADACLVPDVGGV